MGAHQKPPTQGRLVAALVVACIILAIEVVGGLLSNSLALLADAGHVLVDVFAISLSIFAIRVSMRPHTPSLSYGYHRTEILSSFVNGLLLAGVSIYIFFEAFRRIAAPPEVKAPLLLVVASIGLVGNIGMMLLLRGTSRESLNIRGAYLHIWGDTILSLGVLLGGVIVLFTSLFLVDSIIAIAIGGIILRSAYGLVKESAMIMMERIPSGFDPEAISREIMKENAVKGVHDLHIWTLTSGLYVLSAHIIVKDTMISEATELLKRIDEMLKGKFGIQHTTLQLESESMGLLKVKGPRDGKKAG